jgi:hypothetical protein
MEMNLNTPIQSENQNYIVVKEENDLNVTFKFACQGYFFVLIIFLVFLGVLSAATLSISEKDKPIGIFVLLGLSIFVLVIIIFSISKRKIKIIKDKNNRKLIIKIINYFCCCLKTYEFDLDNFGFELEKTCFVRYDVTYEKFNFCFYYGVPNPIDLNNTYLKNMPHKVYEIFRDIIIESRNDLQKSIKNFISPTFINDIKKQFKEIPEYKGNSMLHLVVPRNLLMINKEGYKERYIIKLSNVFYSYISFDYLSFYEGYENFKRIDWIYSPNFDTIFFGVVLNDTTYLNTYIFNVNEIDKYILQTEISGSGRGNLNIVLNNLSSFKIVSFFKILPSTHNLIYLLNYQINKLKNRNFNQNYYP